MLAPAATYAEAYDKFRWRIPARYNIGVDVCDRHAAAAPGATAIVFEDANAVRRVSFGELRAASNRLANVLLARGLSRGDRVAGLLQQSPETAVAHIAAYKAGMIAVPLFVLFGADALEYRLADSGARALITDAANYPKVAALREDRKSTRLNSSH